MDKFDLFGKPISFTLKGKDTFKTECGGFTSILIYVIMVAYGVILGVEPLEATTYASVQSSNSPSGNNSAGQITVGGVTFDGTYAYRKIENVYAGDSRYTEHYPFDHGFNVAVNFAQIIWDYQHLYFEFYFGYRNYEDQINYEYIDFTLGTYDMFPEELHNDIIQNDIYQRAVGLNTTDFAIFGQIDDSNYNFFEVDIAWGDSLVDSNCFEEYDIADNFLGEYMYLYVSEGYFDPSDFENPVKYRLRTDQGGAVNYDEVLETKFHRIRYNSVTKLDGTTEIYLCTS